MLRVPSKKLQTPRAKVSDNNLKGKVPFSSPPPSSSHLCLSAFTCEGDRINKAKMSAAPSFAFLSFLPVGRGKESAPRSGPACQSWSVIASQVTRSRRENCTAVTEIDVLTDGGPQDKEREMSRGEAVRRRTSNWQAPLCCGCFTSFK